MPGAAPAREQMCVVGRSPTRPTGFIFSCNRLPPQPPTTLCNTASPGVLPGPAHLHTHPPRLWSTMGLFPFHLHISIVEEGNDLGADHRAPEPSTYSTNINPSPAWRQACTKQGLFWRERDASGNPSSTTAWTNCFGEKAGNPRVFPTQLLPSLPGLQVP